MGGYVNCACRDCFDIAISDNETPAALCHDCDDAGCSDAGDAECARDDAYGADSLCPLCLSWFRREKCSPECTAETGA